MAAVRRLAAAAAVAIAALLLTSAAAHAADPNPSPDPSRCAGLPATDPSRLAARIACDVVIAGPGGPVQDVQQGAGQALATVAETTFASWLAKGAVWTLQADERQVLNTSTTPGLDPNQAAAYARVYGRVAGVALALSALLLLIGVIEATLTRQPGGLRRVVVGAAVSGLALGAVPAGAAILTRIVDDLTQYIVAGQSTVVPQSLGGLITVLGAADPLTQTAAFAMASLGIMVGGSLLWLELVTRESLIYLFIAVAPLACAAVQWPRLEVVLRQVLFGGLALIVSKLVIAIALVVGFSVLTAGSGLESLLGGMLLLVVAALMPFATARVLPMAADELMRSHHGQLQLWVRGGAAGVGRSVASIATGGATGVPAPVGIAAALLGKSPVRRGPTQAADQQGSRRIATGAADDRSTTPGPAEPTAVRRPAGGPRPGQRRPPAPPRGSS